MSNLDVLILTAYLICVAYVFFQAIDSLKGKIVVELDDESVGEQLANQDLADKIEIGFKFDDNYPIEELQTLVIAVKNKSSQEVLYVDWDRSSLTDIDQRSRRVVRLLSNMKMGLQPSQVPSVITPKKSLKEKLTAEDILKPTDSNVVKPDAPLLNAGEFKKNPNKKYRFTLTLSFWLANPGTKMDNRLPYVLACEFIVRKLSWQDVLPWQLSD